MTDKYVYYSDRVRCADFLSAGSLHGDENKVAEKEAKNISPEIEPYSLAAGGGTAVSFNRVPTMPEQGT
jgi:hypothetical protein